MMRTRFSAVLISLAASFLMAAGFVGCGKEEPAPVQVVKKPVSKEVAKAAESAKDAAAPETKAPKMEFYDPAGKKDPFAPFLKGERRDSPRELGAVPPLQRVDLGELRFVGVIWGQEATRALVEDSEGKGYTVTVGTKIGRGGGVVTRITDGEIFVKEEFRDYAGVKIERESSLKLEIAGGKR